MTTDMGLHDFNLTDSEAMAMEDADAREAERAMKAENGKQKPKNSSKMSPRQRFKYLMAWRSLCAVKGWSESDAALRHELVNDILASSGGEEKRFRDFSQPDYGVVIWCFYKLIAGGLPTVDQLRDMRDQERRRNLLYVIHRLANAYGEQPTRTLLLARFKCVGLDALGSETTETLEQVRRTLTARTYEGKR